jgi:hypothetical protein
LGEKERKKKLNNLVVGVPIDLEDFFSSGNYAIIGGV